MRAVRASVGKVTPMQAFRAWLALFLSLASGTALAQTFGPNPTLLTIPETYQGQQIQLRTWLQIPQGPGPFNTVMLVPGCDGLERNGWAQMQTWARWLMQLHYAVMMIDSFTPRGVSNACRNGAVVPGQLHAADMYTAAAYISHMPRLQGGKIGGIGFSHGGWGVLETASNRMPGIVALRSQLAAKHVSIAALVAVYPACFRHIRASFQVPLLILIGAKDDWTYARTCERLAAYPRHDGAHVRLKVYPNAYHVFDIDKPPRRYLGHELEYDATATADARKEIREFFARWLK
jgi:dienelactone hydrolase